VPNCVHFEALLRWPLRTDIGIYLAAVALMDIPKWLSVGNASAKPQERGFDSEVQPCRNTDNRKVRWRDSIAAFEGDGKRSPEQPIRYSVAKILERRPVSRAGEDRSSRCLRGRRPDGRNPRSEVDHCAQQSECGVLVAMIEVNGAPVELMQIDHSVRQDL